MAGSTERKGLANEALDQACVTVRLLLVDDDAACGRQLQDMLEGLPNHAVAVDPVPDLKSALRKLKQPSGPDVILLDLDLPDSRGIDTAVMILQAAEDTPVVVLARSADQASAWEATEYGVQDVLVRDQVTPESLAWTLRHALEQHGLRTSLERHIRELELSNGRFLSLVADNADAVLVVDRVGIVRFVNPSAEKLLRCSASDLLGQMFGVPLEGVDATEIDLRGRPGRNQIAEIRVMRTLWDGERAFIVTMRDITERKKGELALKLAKQTAEQANAMKTQFLANMSHELRTPLNAIIGYSELMLAEIAGPIQPARYKEYMQDILVGGSHLLSLINDLLDLSKAESGRLELNEDNFDLLLIGQEVVDLLSGDAVTKSIDLSLTTNQSSVWLRGDERMIKQIILNLISNALKFTPKGGRVTMSIDRKFNGDMRISVSDTGIGIPKDEIPRAFAAFVQIDNAYTKAENRGTGLGLALSKRHVELHQGKINIESEPGQGATVTITLPAARAVVQDDTGGKVVSLASCAPHRAR